jgi:hypothetical protein
MGMRTRLKGIGVALFICLLALPLAAIATLSIFPAWRWFEMATGIESVGHSGPAEWCYLVVYLLLVVLATCVWRKIQS